MTKKEDTTNDGLSDGAKNVRDARKRMYTGESIMKDRVDDSAAPNPDGGPGETPNPSPDGRDGNLSPEEQTYRKRFGDLRTYSQRKEQDAAREIQKLKDEVAAFKNKGQALPVSETEIKEWMSKYPELAAAILHLADQTAEQKVRGLQEKLTRVEQEALEVQRDKAYLELKRAHADMDEIRDSQEFAEWVENSPSEITDMLFKNNTDAQLAARAITLFKVETGWGKKKKGKTAETEGSKEASRQVANSRSPEINPEGNAGKRQWRESEIKKLRPAEFEKNEDEIVAAMQEGRIIRDLSHSRA